MNSNKDKLMALLAVTLVMVTTFLPGELQVALINISASVVNTFMSIFITDSMFFDPALFSSNLGHVLTFGLLGFVIGKFLNVAPLPWLIFVLIMFATGSELLQFFVSGREPSFSDLSLNLFSALTGFIITKPFQQKPKWSTTKS